MHNINEPNMEASKSSQLTIIRMTLTEQQPVASNLKLHPPLTEKGSYNAKKSVNFKDELKSSRLTKATETLGEN
jgi:hypothetical protein